MDVKKLWLNEFIGDKRSFIIPVYQRNYDWRTANCEQLFNDIVGTIKSGKPHFIGTFVHIEKPSADIYRELVIIDGQQRLTSVILLAKALYEATDDTKLKTEIRATFIKHAFGDKADECKLYPKEYDLKTFKLLMSDDGFDENNFPDAEKNSPMYLNYQFFRRKIALSTCTPKELFHAVGKLNIVSIMLEQENPQEIFESLNSTGLDLTQADLIRNFLLMPLPYDQQEKLYSDYWSKLEKLLRPSDNVENFLEQYLITKLKSRDAYSTKISSTNLYVVFKRYFANKCADSESCLRDIFRYAKYFHRALFDDDTKFENLSALRKKFYELCCLLEADNAPIILMYLLDRYDTKKDFDEATFINFVDALISLTVRSKVCGNRGINAQFAGNVIARLDKEPTLDTNVFWQAITFGKGRQAFPNDKDFQAALPTRKIYQAGKSGFCKYVLYSLERTGHKEEELPPFSGATIEHILPQNPNDVWKKYLAAHNDASAHEIWLHTLGNLTLTAYNGELGNKEFDEKKKIYKESNYHGTRALADYSDWTSAQIQLRAKKLATKALNVWTVPAEFNNILPSIEENFDLDSDFTLLTGKKPAIISIAGSEKEISKWTALVCEIIRHLREFDKDIFQRAVQLENVPRRDKLFSAESTKLNQSIQIDENLFMESKFDTKTYLKIVKVIVENFDRLGNTGIKNDIYFTLRQ